MISMANKNPLNTKALELNGLSSDEKPIERWTDKYGQTRIVGNGSKFFEIDTSKKFAYDEENKTWNLIKGGSSGGSGGSGSGEEYEYATDPEVIEVVNSADWGSHSTPTPTPTPTPGDDYEYATDEDVLNVINSANW